MADKPLMVFGTPEAAQDDGATSIAPAPAPEKKPMEFGTTQAEPRKLLDYDPDESQLSGIAKGLATVAIKGPAQIPGMLGNLAQMPQLAFDIARARLSGKDFDSVVQERQKAEEQSQKEDADWFQKTYGRPMPHMHTPMLNITGDKIASPVTDFTGEYQSPSMIGRGLMAAGTMIPSFLLGGANAADLGRRALAGIASGFGSQVAGETLGPEAAIAAGSIAPLVTGKGASMATNYAKPFTAKGQREVAAQRLAENTTDVPAAIEKLKAAEEQGAAAGTAPGEIVKGSKPTTPEITADPAQAIAQSVAENTDKNYGARRQIEYTDRNKARLAAMPSVYASPEEVSKAFRAQRDAVDQEFINARTTWAGKAADRAEAITPGDPGKLGGEHRDLQGTAKDTAYKPIDEIWKSIDQDNKSTILTRSIPEGITNYLKTEDPALLSDVVKNRFEIAQKYGAVEPLWKLRKFDKALTSDIKQANISGDSTSREHLGHLKGLVNDAIDNAVGEQHKFEQEQVFAGKMSPEDTLAARMQRQHADAQARQSGQADGARTGTTGTGPDETGSFSPADGTGTVAGGRSSPGAGPAGVQGDDALKPNIIPGTAEAIKAGKAGHAEWAKTFQNPIISPMFANTGFAGDLKMLNSSIPSHVFQAGDKGGDIAKFVMNAANNSPEMIDNMKAIATMRLREAMKGDTLTPTALEGWRKRYGNALSAIDEVSPGFSRNFDDAANATSLVQQIEAAHKQTMKQMQIGAAGELMGLQNPESVVKVMEGILGRKNSGEIVTDLYSRLKDSPEGRAGLSAAIHDAIKNDLQTGTVRGGERVLGGVQAMDLLEKNPTVIRQAFGEEGLKYMQAIADDLKRQKEVFDLQKTGGSNSARNLTDIIHDLTKKAEKRQRMALGDLLTLGAASHGHLQATLEIAALRTALAKAGDYLTGWRGRGMERVHDIFLDGIDNPAIGRALLEDAVDLKTGKINERAFDNLSRALSSANVARQEEDRPGRASGGAVTIDHKAEAEKLIRAVDAARKGQAKDTEPLLAVDDSTITKGLAEAGKDI
jgi:hypothetical protein